MNRPQLYELRIEWFKNPVSQLYPEAVFDEPQMDSINRYARDVSHAVSIGKKFARETLKATGEINVKVSPIK